MSLVQERYEIKRQIEQLSQRLKEIDTDLLEEAEDGEILDVGNGGYYRISLIRQKRYPQEAASRLPDVCLQALAKISESALERMVKEKLLSRHKADEVHAMALVHEVKTLGTFKAHKPEVLEDIIQ